MRSGGHQDPGNYHQMGMTVKSKFLDNLVFVDSSCSGLKCLTNTQTLLFFKSRLIVFFSNLSCVSVLETRESSIFKSLCVQLSVLL